MILVMVNFSIGKRNFLLKSFVLRGKFLLSGHIWLNGYFRRKNFWKKFMKNYFIRNIFLHIFFENIFRVIKTLWKEFFLKKVLEGIRDALNLVREGGKLIIYEGHATKKNGAEWGNELKPLLEGLGCKTIISWPVWARFLAIS